MFEINYYKREDGSCPIIEFLDSLDPKMRAKCLRLLFLLEVNGNELREPYSKALRNGLFELRIKHGTDISRIIYFFLHEHTIVITNGFVKKTNKTPKREISLAQKYRDDYILRKEHCNE